MTPYHWSGRHLVEHSVLGDAGVVDQDVDRPELLRDLRQPRSAFVVVGHVPLVDVNAGLGLELGRRIIVRVIGRRDLTSGGLERL